VTLRTAYPLQGTEEARLRAGVTAALGQDVAAQFERSPDLVSGVELRAGGFKVAWALGDYLESLEDAMAEAVGAEPEPVDG
jgi:F-type H+-transporting ATPase subunit b